MRATNICKAAAVLVLCAATFYGQHPGGGQGFRGGRSAAPPVGNGNLGGRPYPLRTDIALPTGLNPPAAAYTGIAPGGLQVVGGRSRIGGIPIFAAPIYYPGAYGYPNSSIPAYNETGGNVAANSNLLAAQDAMMEQIRRLTADLQQIKSDAAPAPVPVASPVAQPAAEPAKESAPETVPISIVLRDGQQYTSKSYAVMNGMLWDFSSSRVRKFPASSVDIEASAKATEARGGEFPNLGNK